MSESFDGAIVLAQALMADCDKPILNSLQIAHDRDMELADKDAYHRGYEYGKKSMDAEHYAVTLKLRRIRFDGGSHANLSKIAYAIYPCATGWTCESCDGLRDELIRLLGGVHDEPVPVGADCGACGADCACGAGESRRVTYDVLDNERHKAVCALRNVRDNMSDNTADNVSRIMYAIDARPKVGERVCKAIADRLIHLLGGDEPAESFIETLVKDTEELSRQGKVRFPPNADGSLDGLKTVEETAALIDDVKRRADQSHESSPMRLENETGISYRTDEPDSQESPNLANSDGEDGGKVTITADLRECVEKATKTYDGTPWHELGDESEADHTICHITEGELLRVADHIDEWFKRLCWQQEAVLQATINDLIDERNRLQRELSEQKSCAEGFAQTAQAKWYEEQVLKLERELVEVRGAVDRARDGWAKTDEERCELQAKLDAIRETLNG